MPRLSLILLESAKNPENPGGDEVPSVYRVDGLTGEICDITLATGQEGWNIRWPGRLVRDHAYPTLNDALAMVDHEAVAFDLLPAPPDDYSAPAPVA